MTPDELAAALQAQRQAGVPVHVRFDFDGTVADFNVYPDQSRPHPVALAAYEQLSAVDGIQVGVITGRYLAFAEQQFPASFDLDCSYGMEWRHGGEVWRHPGIEQWRPALRRFMERLFVALGQVDARYSFSSEEATETDAIYIERKPAGVSIHDAPARSRKPTTHVTAKIHDAIDLLDGDYEGLARHDNSGNVEFAAPLTADDGEAIDKGTVIDSLDGYIVFSADDTGDLPAVRKIQQRQGVVLGVIHPPDSLRRGSPLELEERATVTFPSVEAHARYISEVARILTSS